MESVDIVPVEGLDVQIGLLLSVLDDVTTEWRGELGEISNGAITWQPFPGGHSIGAVLLHIADVEAHWLHEVAAGQPRAPEELKTLLSEETQQGQVQWPTPPSQPLSWYYAQQDAVRARTSRFVAALNNPLHLGTRRETEFSLRWLLNHVISHEAYHGGQAVLLSLIHEKQRR